MNDATLQEFQRIAETMRGGEPADWQWVGRYLSQRMFGITEKRAREYALLYGGEASKMKG